MGFWYDATPDWVLAVVKYLSPTALQKTQALMLTGAFAMGAATMGAVHQAQVDAQAQAENGETDQAIETLASANKDARGSIHGALRAESAKADARFEAEVAVLNRKVEEDPGILDDEYFDAEVGRIVTLHNQARERGLRAYRRTFAHERLQLEAMSWTPEQQKLVDHRLEELRQIELEVNEALVEGDDLEGALSLEASPGEVEVTYQPVHPDFQGFVGDFGRLQQKVDSDMVSGATQPAVAVLEDDLADTPPEDESVVPDAALGTD